MPSLSSECRVIYVAQVSELTERMHASNFTVSSMHGDMNQRERDATMIDFRNGTTYVRENALLLHI